MNALLKFEQDLEWYIGEYNMMKMFKASKFIARIKCSIMKMDEETNKPVPYMTEIINKIIIYDEWTGKYTWLDDWWKGKEYIRGIDAFWEGQEFIELVGLIDIEDVNVKTLKEIEEMEYGKYEGN